VAFCPAAQAIHYRGGSSTKKDAVWLGLTQQRSVLRYWKKHHGAAANFGIRCLFVIHRMSRWGAALASYLVKPSKRKDSEVRMKVAAACLRDLFSRHNAEGCGTLAQSDAIDAVPHA
jgi:hypothetical protein